MQARKVEDKVGRGGRGERGYAEQCEADSGGFGVTEEGESVAGTEGRRDDVRP